MISQKSLTLSDLTSTRLEVFKAVRFKAQYDRAVIGNIIYLRKYYSGYDYRKGDILDDRILEAVQNGFTEAALMYNVLLLFDHQLDDCLQWTKGGTEKTAIFSLLPEIPYDKVYDLVGQKFTQYNVALQMTLWFGDQSPEKELIKDHFLVNIPHEEVDLLRETLREA